MNSPVWAFRSHRLYMRMVSKGFSSLQADCPHPAGLAYSFLPATTKRRPMQREYHRWYSHRLGMALGVVVYGHWGAPLLGFPTSAGDEWELEGQRMISIRHVCIAVTITCFIFSFCLHINSRISFAFYV